MNPIGPCTCIGELTNQMLSLQVQDCLLIRPYSLLTINQQNIQFQKEPTTLSVQLQVTTTLKRKHDLKEGSEEKSCSMPSSNVIILNPSSKVSKLAEAPFANSLHGSSFPKSRRHKQ